MANDTRFLLVTTDYPPMRGGVARYLGELVKGAGNRVRVVVPEGMETKGPGRIERKMFFRRAWPVWWPAVKICQRAGKDGETLIVSHVLPIGTAARIARLFGGAPYVLICHGLDVRLASRKAWKRLLARVVMRGAAHVIANSHSTAEAVKRISGVGAKVIYPGGALSGLPDRETARTRHGIAPGEYVILAVSRLVERKGIDRLIEAVKMLPRYDTVRVAIVGDGPEIGILRSLVKETPHRIDFFTDASDDCVKEWYAAADVFCLPVRASDDDVEGFGIVFIEAASAGLPVVSTKTGGITEAVLDGETGILVEPSEDPREIARTLTRVLGDADLRKRLGDAGRARALRDFRWEDRWRQFEEIVTKNREAETSP
jgi:phosphatidyl-myo-inositol dimannoside synthase